MSYEPKIIGFLCNWCAYSAADLAGMSRISYPPTIRIVRLMCSGRVDPVIVVDTLANGVDGVLIAGCLPGDCHYLEGNLNAEVKIKMLKKLIAKTGLEPERLRLEWIPASGGVLFAEVITDFTNHLSSLGPSPLAGENPDQSILEKLMAVRDTFADVRLRELAGKERLVTEKGNVYGEVLPKEEFEEKLTDYIDDEFDRHRILRMVKDQPFSVRELSERLDLSPEKVLRHITIMRRKNLLAVDRIEGRSPLYTALEV
ncbi:MAG: hydrogenase iron-sulfur subunit [Candidatus Jordarchaeum sp.]|uniref:hydrogenase iron-sulfur subunit n=1 Tax=Candidatus Jordarchaeum sp. TaxID=2823881 RepID=UPI00404A6BE9